MASETLVSEDIKQGKAVLAALDKAKIPVRTAFWLYAEEKWTLVLATIYVDSFGPLTAYHLIQKALRRHGEARTVPLDRVQLISVKDPLIKSVKGIISMPQTAGEPIRVHKIVVKNVLIEDAYIYRST